MCHYPLIKTWESKHIKLMVIEAILEMNRMKHFQIYINIIYINKILSVLLSKLNHTSVEQNRK